MCGRAVNTLNSRSGGLGFKPDICCIVSLDKEIYCTSSLFTEVYKWVLAT